MSRHLLMLNGSIDQSRSAAHAARDQQDIQDRLTTVFTSWSGAGAYAFYLLDLPGIDMKLVDRNAADVPSIKATGDAGKPWRPYPDIVADSAKIQLVVPKTMTMPLPRLEICVMLDSVGVPVTAPAAFIVSASFAVGLVTRLMLKRFGDNTTRPFVKELNDALARNAGDLVSQYGATELTFGARFTQLAQTREFQSTGLMLGWNAGGEVVTADARVLSAIWWLIHSRLSWLDIGELTAYGLSYLLGFSRVQKVLRDAKTAIDAGQITDPATILQQMKGDTEISSLESVINTLFSKLINSFKSAAKNPPKPGLVENYVQFLNGYQHGSLRAASDIFGMTLLVSYELGYIDGFRVGYARGYTDGYKAGYKDGDETNWVHVLDDVATIVEDVTKVIGVFAA
jgi:hypothetical protein